MKIPASVCLQLRELADDRKSGGVKLLAEKVNVDKRTLHRLFKDGVASPSTMRRIAQALPQFRIEGSERPV